MQCLGKTRRGTTCSRISKKGNYCYQHGGNLPELPPELNQEYELLDLIDCGNNCVYRIRDRELGILRAIKIIDYSRYNQRECALLATEVNVMASLKGHPRVVQYVKRYLDKDASTLYIIMGYLSNSVEKYLKEHSIISDELALKIAQQTLEGLALLQSHRIIHNDIKPANLLLDDVLNVVISDFGMICQLKAREFFCRESHGTPLYMSPEKMHDRPFNYTGDLWSLGVTLYEMITGVHPFKGDHIATLALKIDEGIYSPITGHLPKVVNLIQDLLQVFPVDRSSASELLEKYWGPERS